LFERSVGSGAPGNRRIAGFDPAKIELTQAFADDGDCGRIAPFADKDSDPQIDKVDRRQDIEDRGVEDPFNVPTGSNAGVSSNGGFPCRGPSADQPVMIAEWLIEDGGDIDG